jgi:hypothetical protein
MNTKRKILLPGTTAILVPGTTGLYTGAYRAAKLASKNKALVTSRFGLVKSLLRLRLLTKVIIIMGAKGHNASDTYQILEEIISSMPSLKKKVKIIVMDGWRWCGIPNQVLLTGRNMVKAIAELL